MDILPLRSALHWGHLITINHFWQPLPKFALWKLVHEFTHAVHSQCHPLENLIVSQFTDYETSYQDTNLPFKVTRPQPGRRPDNIWVTASQSIFSDDSSNFFREESRTKGQRCESLKGATRQWFIVVISWPELRPSATYIKLYILMDSLIEQNTQGWLGAVSFNLCQFLDIPKSGNQRRKSALIYILYTKVPMKSLVPASYW